MQVSLFRQAARRGLKNRPILGHFVVFESTHHQYLREDHMERAIQEESCDGCPTVDDFLLSFNDTISDLQGEGNLMNIVSVTKNLTEQEPVNCTSEVTEFKTTTEVTFKGDPNIEPSDTELESLATSFVDSYNSANTLNGDLCDPVFRVAVDAELIDTYSGSRHHRKLESTGTYTYPIHIHGTCRGCQQNTRLFGGSVSGRRALCSNMNTEHPEWILQAARQVHFFHSNSRELQVSNTTSDDCYGPVGNPEIRPPTQEEFEEVYNEDIKFLRADEKVTSIQVVEDVVEVLDTVAPTMQPSPTSAPTTTQPEPTTESPTTSPAISTPQPVNPTPGLVAPTASPSTSPPTASPSGPATLAPTTTQPVPTESPTEAPVISPPQPVDLTPSPVTPTPSSPPPSAAPTGSPTLAPTTTQPVPTESPTETHVISTPQPVNLTPSPVTSTPSSPPPSAPPTGSPTLAPTTTQPVPTEFPTETPVISSPQPFTPTPNPTKPTESPTSPQTASPTSSQASESPTTDDYPLVPLDYCSNMTAPRVVYSEVDKNICADNKFEYELNPNRDDVVHADFVVRGETYFTMSATFFDSAFNEIARGGGSLSAALGAVFEVEALSQAGECGVPASLEVKGTGGQCVAFNMTVELTERKHFNVAGLGEDDAVLIVPDNTQTYNTCGSLNLVSNCDTDYYWKIEMNEGDEIFINSVMVSADRTTDVFLSFFDSFNKVGEQVAIIGERTNFKAKFVASTTGIHYIRLHNGSVYTATLKSYAMAFRLERSNTVSSP